MGLAPINARLTESAAFHAVPALPQKCHQTQKQSKDARFRNSAD
jgi:hypothetical protein